MPQRETTGIWLSLFWVQLAGVNFKGGKMISEETKKKIEEAVKNHFPKHFDPCVFEQYEGWKEDLENYNNAKMYMRMGHALATEEKDADTKRLEWMIENAGWYRHTYHDEEHTYIQIKVLKGADLSCRPMVLSAIDAAMSVEKK